ncbi:MAG: hypothetical protein EOO23_03870 [Comamonadaceae bacterium]|nr:MAG: hypothetical protein EOO23_03870 [Comamonadaceae bacterium]
MQHTDSAALATRPRRRPIPPIISLDQPGRLRIANLMALLSISHQSVYVRLRTGKIPPPDGNDGRPYWNTATIKQLLT